MFQIIPLPSRAAFVVERRIAAVLMLASAAAFTCGAAMFAPPAHAQFGDLFAPLRPPGAVPVPEPDDEQVPDLPRQGRVLPTPNRAPPPGQGLPPPGSVRSQPLPPQPGSPPGVANAPPVNSPGLPPSQRPARPPATANAPPAPPTLQPGDEIVSEPPKQRVTNKQAVFSGLDKITGRIINFEADIGETVQFGALRVKTDACYTRPATEAANTDAFVSVEEITLQGEVRKIFSGWMFAASPGLHAVEHPIYDVWLTDCKGAEPLPVAAAEPPRPAPAAQKRAAPPPQKRAPAPPPPPPQPFPPFR